MTDAEIKKLPEPERTPTVYAGTVNPQFAGMHIDKKWYPKGTYFLKGKPVLPPTMDGKPMKCVLQNWDFELQGLVASIPSRSRKGVVKIFGRLVRDILAEEKHQNKASEPDLIAAEKMAQEIQKANKERAKR